MMHRMKYGLVLFTWLGLGFGFGFGFGLGFGFGFGLGLGLRLGYGLVLFTASISRLSWPRNFSPTVLTW